MKIQAGIVLFVVAHSANAIEGTAYSGTEELRDAIWGTYGQGTVPIDTTNFTLSQNFSFDIDPGITWYAGSLPPPVGFPVGTPKGRYFKNVRITSVGGQRHNFSLTSSSPNRIITSNLYLKDARMFVGDGVNLSFTPENQGQATDITLDNSDLVFSYASDRPEFGQIGAKLSPLHFNVSGTSLIQGFTNGNSGAYGLHGDEINLATNSRLTILDWDAIFQVYGTKSSFTINADAGSTLYIQRLDAGTTGFMQQTSHAADIDFQINLTNADFVLDNSPIDVDAINADASTLSFKSGASLARSGTASLTNGSQITIEDGANVAELKVEFAGGANALTTAMSGATALRGLAFKGGQGSLVSSDAAGFSNLTSFGATPGSEVTIGQTGDAANTSIGLNSSAFMIVDDSLVNGHVDFDFQAGATLLFRNSPQFSPGVGVGDIGEMVFNLNGTAADNSTIPGVASPTLDFNIELGDSSNDNDKLVFSGGALAGTHDVLLAPKATTYTADDLDGNTYDVVQVDAGQDASTYTLNTAATMPAAISATGVKSSGANDVYTVTLTKDLNQIATHSNLVTKNQKVAAQNLVNQAPTNTAVNTQLNTVTVAQVSSLANDAHAEPVASHLTVGLEQAEMIINSVFMRNVEFAIADGTNSFAPNFLGGNTVNATNVWADVAQVNGSIDASSNEAGFDYDLSQMTLGSNLIANERNFMGVYFSVVDQSMDEHDAQDISFDTTGYHVGGYWSGRFDSGVELDGVLGYGLNETDSVRTLSTAPKAEASFDARLMYIALQVAKPVYKSDLVNAAPFASYSYVSAKQDAYSESGGGALALNVDESTARSSVVGLGLMLEKDLDDHDGLSATGLIRYDRDLSAGKSGDHSVTVSSGGAPGTYTGQNRGANTWTLGVAARYHFAEQHYFSGGATMSKFDNGDETGLGLSYAYQF